MSTTTNGSIVEQHDSESLPQAEEPIRVGNNSSRDNHHSGINVVSTDNMPQRPPLLPSYTQVLRDTAVSSNTNAIVNAVPSESVSLTSSNGNASAYHDHINSSNALTTIAISHMMIPSTRNSNNNNDRQHITIIVGNDDSNNNSSSSGNDVINANDFHSASSPSMRPSHDANYSLEAGTLNENNSSSHLLLSQPYTLRAPYNPYPDPGQPPPDNLRPSAPPLRARLASLRRISSNNRIQRGLARVSTMSLRRNQTREVDQLDGFLYANENPYTTEMQRMQIRVVQLRRLLILPILALIVLCISAQGFHSYFLPVPILIVFVLAFLLLYILRLRRARKQANIWEERAHTSHVGGSTTIDTNRHQEGDEEEDELLASTLPIRPPPTYDQAKRVPPPHSEAIREYEDAVALALSHITTTPQPSTSNLNSLHTNDDNDNGAHSISRQNEHNSTEYTVSTTNTLSNNDTLSDSSRSNVLNESTTTAAAST
ncbi:hypothetical protein BDF22DRAFT_743423 [Syncephalis plumigaleata]|nr:hypothetical protein BDF22DRAFT_743423 [Syncephalis plumigaleata]